jgi:TRAP-type uncharacterized transport system fused permease subunit
MAMIIGHWTVPQAGLAGIASVIILAGLKGAWNLIARSRTEAIGIGDVFACARRGVENIFGALERGARQSVPICAAVATVGIVIGGLLQTSLGIKFSSIVISLAQGNLFLGILLVGFASFILGMGLPTTAAYIVLSVMAVPALMELGGPWGLSLLTAHLVVFWYSLDSCFTPPVCVPAYTAAGIADANANKTAWAAFRLAKGMYVIPLMFVYTPLLDFSDPIALGQTFAAAMFGFIALGAVMVGYFVTSLKAAERLLLGVAALALFWPMMVLQLLGGAILIGIFFLQRARMKREPTTTRGAVQEAAVRD